MSEREGGGEMAGIESLQPDERLFPGATEAGLRDRIRRLRVFNLAMGLFHGAQGFAILALSTGFTLPVVAHVMTGPPGAPQEATTLFDLRIAWAVAAFLFISAVAHLLIASPGVFPRYERMLRAGRNDYRWIEYSISASIMAVLIAMLPGINDVAALIAIFGVNAAMIFFGLVQERYERPGGSLLPFWIGSLVGITPWLAIGLYLTGFGTGNQPPGFVYAIFFSIFLFFMSFSVNQWLQYKRNGPWRDYLYGERVYVILSLVAKSALAWQVFAGTLAGN